jgi:hypothetical protein
MIKKFFKLLFIVLTYFICNSVFSQNKVGVVFESTPLEANFQNNLTYYNSSYTIFDSISSFRANNSSSYEKFKGLNTVSSFGNNSNLNYTHVLSPNFGFSLIANSELYTKYRIIDSIKVNIGYKIKLGNKSNLNIGGGFQGGKINYSINYENYNWTLFPIYTPYYLERFLGGTLGFSYQRKSFHLGYSLIFNHIYFPENLVFPEIHESNLLVSHLFKENFITIGKSYNIYPKLEGNLNILVSKFNTKINNNFFINKKYTLGLGLGFNNLYGIYPFLNTGYNFNKISVFMSVYLPKHHENTYSVLGNNGNEYVDFRYNQKKLEMTFIYKFLK